MRPTRMISVGELSRGMPPLLEDFDAPAYTRGLIPLSEVKHREVIESAARVDASNRTFNQQFWSTLASERGGVSSGIDTVRLGRWVRRFLARKPDGSPMEDESEPGLGAP